MNKLKTVYNVSKMKRVSKVTVKANYRNKNWLINQNQKMYDEKLITNIKLNITRNYDATLIRSLFSYEQARRQVYLRQLVQI